MSLVVALIPWMFSTACAVWIAYDAIPRRIPVARWAPCAALSFFFCGVGGLVCYFVVVRGLLASVDAVSEAGMEQVEPRESDPPTPWERGGQGEVPYQPGVENPTRQGGGRPPRPSGPPTLARQGGAPPPRHSGRAAPVRPGEVQPARSSSAATPPGQHPEGPGSRRKSHLEERKEQFLPPPAPLASPPPAVRGTEVSSLPAGASRISSPVSPAVVLASSGQARESALVTPASRVSPASVASLTPASAGSVASPASVVVSPEVQADVETILERALRLVDQGNPAGALDAIGPPFGPLAHDPRLALVRAVLLKGFRRWRESLAAYDGVLGADPKHAEAWRQKGECLRFLGRTAEACRCLEMSVSLLAEQAEAWASLARCHEATGSDQQALACWERAVTSARDVECGWWVTKAECETRLGRDADAIASYRAFLSVAPTGARRKATRVRAALAALASPPPPEVLLRAAESYQCAVALMDQGRWRAALGVFGDNLRAAARAPGLLWVCVGGRPVELQAAALSHMGMCLEQAGDLRGALSHYRRALEVDATNARVQARAGSCLVRLGRFREAARRLDGALRLEACPAEALHDHAHALWRLGQPQAALRSLEEWLALAPADAKAWNLRGCLLAETGLPSEAVASFDRALSLRPDSSEARYNRDRLAS